MRYRRTRIQGGTYFFTVNLADRRDALLVEHVAVLRDAFRYVKQRRPFHIDAMVILPDHLHAIWTLPPRDADFSTRWMLIKNAFSRQIPPGEHRCSSRLRKGERAIWQRRYWEHSIRNDEDFARHVDYIHYNPVKHGYVQRAVDWRHSSIHRFIADGVISPSWGNGMERDDGSFGERD